MKDHSVIFIGNQCEKYERLNRFDSEEKFPSKIWANFMVSPKELPKRIISSFIPPVLGINSRKVYVDFVGPFIALALLWFMLNSGHSDKHPKAMLETPPSLTLAYYCLAMPSLCIFLAKIGQSNLTISEVTALLGYGLYGHILTIFACYLFNMESSNLFFFTAMIICSGLSALRLVIVFLLTIPKPVVRLLVCSVTTIFHLLFLVFIHFAYMHKTFKYGGSKLAHI